MRRILGIGLIVVSSAALLATGVGPAAAQSVSPAKFVKQICASIATVDKSGKAASAATKAAAKAYRAAPSAATAVALRDTLAQQLQNLDQQFASVITATQQVGTPANATEFTTAFVAELEAQRAVAQQLVQQVGAVDTSSASAFATSLQQVVDATKAESSKSHAEARS